MTLASISSTDITMHGNDFIINTSVGLPRLLLVQYDYNNISNNNISSNKTPTTTKILLLPLLVLTTILIIVNVDK